MSSIPMWHEAVSFACRAHGGQMRKDDVTPYVSHVVRVAMIVRDVFGCDDQPCLCAAFLHDVIEDTPADYDDVLERFGETTADCVAALTKDMRLPEQERERLYDEGLARAGWRAKLIKLADVMDNYNDRTQARPGTSASKQIEKCRRAIEIARGQSDPPECLMRGIDAVERFCVGETGL